MAQAIQTVIRVAAGCIEIRARAAAWIFECQSARSGL